MVVSALNNFTVSEELQHMYTNFDVPDFVKFFEEAAKDQPKEFKQLYNVYLDAATLKPVCTSVLTVLCLAVHCKFLFRLHTCIFSSCSWRTSTTSACTRARRCSTA